MNLSKPKLRWVVHPLAIVLYSFILNLTDIILYTKLTKGYHLANFIPISCLCCDAFIFVIVVYEQHPNIIKLNRRWSKNLYWFIDKILKKAVWLFLLVMCILNVVRLSLGKISNPLDLNQTVVQNLHLTSSQRIAYLVISLFSLLFNCALLGIWWSTSISSVYLLFACINFIQILISISIIQINIDLINVSYDRFAKRMHNLFILSSAFVIGQSIMGRQ